MMSLLRKFAAPSVCLVVAAAAATAQTVPSFELKRDTFSSYGSAIGQGDFNLDGKPDLILGGGAQPNNLTLRIGNGDGTFQAPRTIGSVAGYSTVEMVAADVNHDGKLDLVALDIAGYVNIFYGKGDGSFTPGTPFAAIQSPNSIAVADFNGDGLLDLAIGDQASGVEIFSNVGGKNFTHSRTIQLPVHPGLGVIKLRAGDVEGTGVNDLAVLLNSAAYVLWGDGHGSFSTSLLASYPAPASINFGDLKQNGKSEILVSSHCAGAYAYPSMIPYVPCMAVDAFTSNGSHSMVSKSILHDGTVDANQPWVADVNGDGIADLVSATSDKQDTQDGIFVWLGKADGTYLQTPQRYIATADGGNDLVMGDWNRDGMIDFAEPVGTESEVQFYLNGGTRGACTASTSASSIALCAPVDGTYSPRPIKLVANAYDKAGVSTIQEFVDGTLLSTHAGSSAQSSFTASLGIHTFAAKAWDKAGASVSTVHRVTVYDGTPGATCAATLGTANLCVATTAVSGARVHITGNGYTAHVPTAAQLYIDGNLVIDDKACTTYCPGGSSSVDTWQTFAYGDHRLTFKLWDTNGNVYTSTKTIEVR